MSLLRHTLFLLLLLPLAATMSSCSDEEPPVKSANDILGVWTDGNGYYMNLREDTRAYTLSVSGKGEEASATFDLSVYFYEPGYDILLWIDGEAQPNVYQVVSLTDDKLVWCWVDNLRDDKYDGLSKSELIGQIIQQAHDGYPLDPARYQTFTRTSTEIYLHLLERFGFEEPESTIYPIE